VQLMGKRKTWSCLGAAILLVAAISSASPRGAGFLPLPSSTRDPLLQCMLSMLGRRGELRGGRRARKGGAVERGLSPIQVLDLRSMHMGGSLHMRGGAPGGHSAIFVEDTKKRKAAGGGEQRSVQEILQGAMLREKRRRVGGWESLSLSELKVKLKELGVEQRKIAACFERSQRLCHALAPCPPLPSLSPLFYFQFMRTTATISKSFRGYKFTASHVHRKTCPAVETSATSRRMRSGSGTEEGESGHHAFLRRHCHHGEAIVWQGILNNIMVFP
jgi:hypothetical protein